MQPALQPAEMDGINLTPQQKNLLGACIADMANVIPGSGTVRDAIAKLDILLDSDDIDAIQAHRDRLRSILDDMERLPLKQGSACPTPEQLTDVDDVLKNNQALFGDIAEKLEHTIQASGKTTFTEIYNEIQVTNDRNGPLIWDRLTENPEVEGMLRRVSGILASSINQENPEQVAWSEIEKLMINQPIQHVNPKTPALILLRKVKGAIAASVIRRITDKVQKGDMALLPGGEKVEQPRAWTDSMEATMNFLTMEDMRYIDMISNPLGQAQTADSAKAEPYFRKHETVQGAPHNNFSYVYVTKEQWENIASESGAQPRSFMYMGEDYLAIPIGQYYAQKAPDLFAKTIASLQSLAEHFQGTPAEDFYKKLLEYWNFGQNHGDLQGEAFAKKYYDICYATERAWVTYVKFAEAVNLPFIHVHSFEKYRTVSTKEHDVAVAILEPKETAVYMEGKRKFSANARAFLEREGMAEKWPDMVEEVMRVIESAGCVSLGGRVGSVSGAMLAESIPEELDGKRDGIITLFDTQFAQGRLKSLYGNMLKADDILGGLTERYTTDIQDLEKFMRHFIMSVLAHELNHNMYQGSRTSFESDGKGLAVILAEEAKATHGLALSFKDPYHLTPEELDELRTALPLMLPWNIFRLRRVMRAEHTSHQYLREGTVMIDHAIKSGVVEVRGMKIRSEKAITFEDVPVDQGDATFIRFNLGDQQLQDYITRTTDFLKQLAAPYHQTQFSGDLPAGTVVPDITNIEAWQAASFLCYNEQIEGLRAKGETSEIPRLEAERDALARTWTPEMQAQIQALIHFVDQKEMGKFDKALREAMEKSPAVDHLDEATTRRIIEEFKKDLRLKFPQVHKNGEPC